MAQYVMGIDVGTTGAKAIVFDSEGNVAGTGYKEYACEYPRPNWVEQDADMLRSAVLEVCADAVNNAGLQDAGDIISVSVSAQRCCVLFIDKDGNVLKMISWLDNRADEEVDRLEKEVGAARYYAITGMPLSTVWILPKVMWVQKNEPELWKNTGKIVQLHDYIAHCLGAEDYYSDEPDSAFWGFWDTDKLSWHDDFLQTYDIRKDMLPEVRMPGTCIGRISKNIARITGLSENTALCVGAGDQNCAAVGAGVVRPGMASVSIGTGGLATVFLPNAFRDPQGKMMVTNSAVHGNWQLEGLQNGAAGVLRWFRDEIGALDKREAEEAGEDPYVRLNRMIAKSPPGGNGLVFLPYLASAASPRYDQDARGTLIGLTFLHGRGDIARATIEGITMEQKDILTAMRNAGLTISRIRIIGGATKSSLWNQLQANCYGCPVETLKITDAAVMGAALCACVGVKLYTDIPAASDVLVRVDQTYTHQKDMVEFYDESYRLYVDAYEGLSSQKIFEGIAKRQKENA